MNCFEEILAWQKARGLVREVYKICYAGQLRRDFGLRDQMCRAAVSSMSNIAEGFARKNDGEFARFLDIAKASTTEVQSLLYVALDAGYATRAEFEQLYQQAAETASLISGLTSYLRRGPKPKENAVIARTTPDCVRPNSRDGKSDFGPRTSDFN